jgi:hypothetical protein
MSRLNGLDAARKPRDIHPNVPILLYTWHAAAPTQACPLGWALPANSPRRFAWDISATAWRH